MESSRTQRLKVIPGTPLNVWYTRIDIERLKFETHKQIRGEWSERTDMFWWTCNGFLGAPSCDCIACMWQRLNMHFMCCDQLRYEQIAFCLELPPGLSTAQYVSSDNAPKELDEKRISNFLPTANCVPPSWRERASVYFRAEEQSDFPVRKAQSLSHMDYVSNLCLQSLVLGACHWYGFAFVECGAFSCTVLGVLGQPPIPMLDWRASDFPFSSILSSRRCTLQLPNENIVEIISCPTRKKLRNIYSVMANGIG